MRKQKIILIHLVVFMILTVIWFFSAEPLLHIFAPGIHHVLMWLDWVVCGTITILMLTIISCVTFIKSN